MSIGIATSSVTKTFIRRQTYHKSKVLLADKWLGILQQGNDRTPADGLRLGDIVDQLPRIHQNCPRAQAEYALTFHSFALTIDVSGTSSSG